MPDLAAWQWLLAVLSAAFVGVAKTGVPGFGILAVPLMVLAVGDARAATGWLLPLLCIADLFAIAYYRRHAHLRRVLLLVPWILPGMVLGDRALAMSERTLRPVVGAIILTMIAVHVLRRWRSAQGAPETWRYAAPFGIAAGFATTVANAAGPVMNVYLLGKRLPKEEFIAAGAWLFFLINLTKVPLMLRHDLIGRSSLVFDALLLPAVALGAVLGRAVFVRLPQRVFEIVVFGLTVAATLLLFFA